MPDDFRSRDTEQRVRAHLTRLLLGDDPTRADATRVDPTRNGTAGDDPARDEAARRIAQSIDGEILVGLAAAVGVPVVAATDAAQRDRLLARLMRGTCSSADLDLLASGYGLRPHTRWRAVRSRPCGEARARAVQRALLETGTELVGRVDGELLAVVPADAAVAVPVATGIGGPAQRVELPRSFAEAASALAAATAFDLPGASTLDELGVKVAVATGTDIGTRLADRFVAPMLALGPAGIDTLATLDAHLCAGLRVNRTAQLLYVHPNTVRHRLRRFETATGARLDDIEDVVAVWWALRHHDLHRNPAGG